MVYMKAKHISLAVFLLCSVGTVFFRVYQLMRPNECSSDFFSSEFFCFFLNVIGYVVMALCAKFFPDLKKGNNACGTGLCNSREIFAERFTCRNGLVAFISVVFGIFVCVNGVMILQKYITGVRNVSPLAEGIFAAAAGIIFILTGVCYGIGRNLFVNNELLTILPVAWGVSRSINIFLRYHVVSNVAWELSDVLATVFLSLFLLNHAKCLANRREDLKRKSHMRLYGYSAALFALVYISKKLLECKFDLANLASINGGSSVFYAVFGFLMVDASAFFYILSVLLCEDLAKCESCTDV